MLKQLDFIQLTLPETRLHSFSDVMRSARFKPPQIGMGTANNKRKQNV